jgi:hypothetical protein
LANARAQQAGKKYNVVPMTMQNAVPHARHLPFGGLSAGGTDGLRASRRKIQCTARRRDNVATSVMRIRIPRVSSP